MTGIRYQLFPGWFQAVSGSFRLYLGGFKSFLVLLSTEHLNVGLDLMCSFLCRNLFRIRFCPLETLERRTFLKISKISKGVYIVIYMVLHPTCPNILNFRKDVGPYKWTSGKSVIQAVWYQIVSHSRRSIYYFELHENPTVGQTHLIFW